MMKPTEKVYVSDRGVQVYENSAKPVKTTPQLEEKYNLRGRVKKMAVFNANEEELAQEPVENTILGKSALSGLPSNLRNSVQGSYVLRG